MFFQKINATRERITETKKSKDRTELVNSPAVDIGQLRSQKRSERIPSEDASAHHLKKRTSAAHLSDTFGRNFASSTGIKDA